MVIVDSDIHRLSLDINRTISLGVDTDTMACIAGNIAAATKPVPKDIAAACYDKLPQELREILDRWNSSVESIRSSN